MIFFKVLLVEDDSDWQDILEGKIRTALSNIGHPKDIIQIVRTFDEASKAFRDSDWHLLITDIGLGDSSIARRQKLGIHLVELAYSRQIPAIAVSGTPVVNTQDVRDLLMEYKAYDFFSKRDFDSKKFINKVQNILHNELQKSSNHNEILNSSTVDDKQFVITANPLKILFLASDPTDTARLRLGEELREIQQRLQLAKQRGRFLLEQRLSVRPGDISQALLDIEPHIVHFSGHGINTGELYVENELGKIQPLKPDALASLFELVEDQVNCVVLNACYSQTQAEAIAKYIPFVIGMNHLIGDQAAIAFSVGFYKALGANRSIEKAYKFGCTEIQLHGIAENLTPVIYKKTI
ncbi:CHAT domain-containing protein [Nostoc sp. T09]|uniref:CHAT domain-containing protein n=1 Tax=Nostoc sp. T09 TaxID=1932621 RepID=UPI00211B300B|nr:CHAT domain-containing protein [Nostoc sp. T09]